MILVNEVRHSCAAPLGGYMRIVEFFSWCVIIVVLACQTIARDYFSENDKWLAWGILIFTITVYLTARLFYKKR